MRSTERLVSWQDTKWYWLRLGGKIRQMGTIREDGMVFSEDTCDHP